ncbi:MAG: hypothetical protein J3R72DRAFT_460136 [Linnemannia gamsii]|nr:MAG: hypothetical protein J3R72DRAFT_460136 [Linnemannia gamsii]
MPLCALSLISYFISSRHAHDTRGQHLIFLAKESEQKKNEGGGMARESDRGEVIKPKKVKKGGDQALWYYPVGRFLMGINAFLFVCLCSV